MLRRCLQIILAAVIAPLAAAYSLPAEASQDQPPLAIDNLRITRDRALTGFRWMCVTDQVPAMIEGGRARGFDMPSVEEFCEVAAEEAARRGSMDAIYARMEAGPPDTVWHAIIQGGLSGEGRFTAPNGAAFGLPCPLAFEAGYRFGVEKPDHQVGANLDAAAIERLQRACFTEHSTLSRADGLAVGARKGQAFARRHLSSRAQ